MRALVIVALFAVFAAPALELALTLPVAMVTMSVILLTVGVTFAGHIYAHRGDDPFRWRRLPWAGLLYLAWAALSLLWSAWPAGTALTVVGMLGSTLVGIFAATVLSWRELIRALGNALQWVLGLSLVLELYVSLFVHAPLMPTGLARPEGHINPQIYWSRNNLFDGGRIQGIVGNANLLGILCVVAIIIFLVRITANAPGRNWLIGWTVVASFLLWRTESVTSVACLFGAAIVLCAIMAMRRARTATARTKTYAAFVAIVLVGGALVFVLQDSLLKTVGRSDTLTGRSDIWAAVAARISEHPIIGWGFTSPWVPWEPHIKDWIIDQNQTVMQAHNMWLDVLFQVGAVGMVLIAITLLALVWRSWFFAVDRPRWDANAERPFTALSTLPSLLVSVLLVQSITESNPAMLWGWMVIMLLSFKIKSAPIVGFGADERYAERDLPERSSR